MDLTTLLTIIGSFLAVSGIMIALFLHLYSKMDSLISSINIEMRDFHGRLCAIEERKRNEKR